MKNNSILFLVLLGSIINYIFITTIATADNETQSPEEIAQIQAANEEYEKAHPKPKTLPPLLTTSWIETSTDGKSLSIRTVHSDNETIVYTDKKTNTYHMGYCEYYKEKSDSDYSNPQWLADIVMSGTRCTLCIPDEVYYTCREAVYRHKIEQAEQWISLMKNIIITIASIYVFSAIVYIIRRSLSK